jgi:ribosomal protein S18 acetylase RimI-like enzyme
MIIREYQEGDFQEVESLWKATGVYRPERGDSPETILRCTRQGGKFLILEDEKDKRITGTSWLTWDGRRVHMQYFAILPVLQGKGYGRKLAEASMSFARTLQAPIKLEVHRHSIPAVKLYQSMGFKVLKGYDVYMVHN